MRTLLVRRFAAVAGIAALALLVGPHRPAEGAFGPIKVGSAAYVKSTTYYFCNSANGTHYALDICVGNPCGGCNVWYVRSMLNGAWTYNWFGGCAADCNGSSCNGGAGNYYKVNGINGYNFRQLHLNASGDSFTKTVDNGVPLGWLGSTGGSTAPHVHADNRQYTTRLTAWYVNAGITCGSPAEADDFLGLARME